MKRGVLCGWLAAALTAGLLPHDARSGEMVVEGEVVRVEPLGGGEERACRRPRPDGAGVVELLAWDLRADCTPGPGSASAYRVYYRWDGRTYSQVMDRPPGDTVSLRVRVQ